MSVEEIVSDANGKKLAVGARVRIAGYDPAKDDYKEFHGTVREISESDVDSDDYGRTVLYCPGVTVHFDDDVEDTFRATRDSGGSMWDEGLTFTCDDVEIV
jgi:hypothetical protein